ncbi:aromatic ring-hydroxylating dioxygenase subunit alpha [Temperatibacter marinus]|uniref:Aromatic ring-hydroxylating dioxygenase subunit alpha n=1 Tax=Temperatibacter marinus TaxID=1456591 RepID=A0AA52EHL5_9PROT|nr:aromatic ring-hydroxylating dioxygenase subunit alpha [Temperatibacter marinus]WND02935.1 aromatic ring-hydroxylating dioxygenase subunit alpha [Temperatibacter marinus]
MKVQEKRASMGDYASRPRRADGSQPGWSLPRRAYKDPAIYEQEKEAIFYNSWIFAGHVNDIPGVGDYFLYTLLDETAIIVRSSENVIEAFYNVCRHRGSILCKESKGSVKGFTCPYHAWTYKLDGKLMTKRSMGQDFSPEDFSLHPCAIEIIDGLIFVNFSPTPNKLDRAREELKGPLTLFDFEATKVAVHRSYPIAANWKVTLENYQECYHCTPSHPEYAQMHTLTVPEHQFDNYQQPMLDKMAACGLKHYEIDQQWDHQETGQEQYGYSRYALFETHQTGSQSGEPIAPLLGSLKGFDHGASDLNIGPFTYFLIYNDHAVIYVFTPTGPDTSQCDIYWLVRSDAEEGFDYKIDELTWLWHETTLADERIIVDNQKGINSRLYKPGPLSKMEYLVDRFSHWYLDQLHKD